MESMAIGPEIDYIFFAFLHVSRFYDPDSGFPKIPK